MKYKKKGQVGGQVTAIITLIVGIGVAVMVLIFVGSLGGQTYNVVEPKIASLTGSIVNESFVAVNQTAVALSQNEIHSGTLTILNNSNAATIGLGNFSIDYTVGTLTLDTAHVGLDGATMLASYDYGNSTIEEGIKQGIISSFNALEQTGSYLPIIVLAVVISLVLGLVLGFGGLGKGSGGNAL